MIGAREQGKRARARIRSGEYRRPTSGLAPGCVQANLVIVRREWADELTNLCARNPVPCPLVERLPAGSWEPQSAPGADLRYDLGAYRVWENGALVRRVHDLSQIWNDDLVAFLIGCSFTFEDALREAGLPAKHETLGQNVPMYRTTLLLAPAGRLHGTWVVSMRPYHRDAVERVRTITRPCTAGHGEPVHWGDPARLGIADIAHPEEGDAIVIAPDEVPVFWGCGVTPQTVIRESGVPFAITHEPGFMFVTDLRADRTSENEILTLR